MDVRRGAGMTHARTRRVSHGGEARELGERLALEREAARKQDLGDGHIAAGVLALDAIDGAFLGDVEALAGQCSDETRIHGCRTPCRRLAPARTGLGFSSRGLFGSTTRESYGRDP